MSESPAQVRQIECDLLFDGRKLVEGALVRLEGERVSAVLPLNDRRASEVDTPPVDGVIHTPFLMPGLIDSHVHSIGFTEGLPGGAPFKPVKHFMRLCIYNGVTSVRDTGNNLETIFYLREWTQKFPGPRVFASGPLLDTPPLTWAFSRIVRDEASARREVHALADQGVDLIKAYRNIAPDVLEFIVQAASERNLPVAIDSEATSVRRASELGVRSIEHAANLLQEKPAVPEEQLLQGMLGRAQMWSRVDLGDRVTESLVGALVANGTYVVPTLLVSRRWCLPDEMFNDPYLDYMVPVMPYHRYFKQLRSPIGRMIGKRFAKKYMPMPDLSRSQRSEVEAGLDQMGAMVRLLHQAGVRLAAGTDTPNPSLAPGFSLHQELAEMVRHGIPPLAALASATSSAASLLARETIGVVESGAVADLLMINGNPAERIEDLGRIEGVVKGGQLVDLARVHEKLQEEMERA